MSERDTGGPAFPTQTYDSAAAHNGIGVTVTDDPGMTLRDWFAGQALPQAVEDYGQPDMMKSTGQRRDRGNPVLPYATSGTMTREQIIALQAYRYADAMLEARK